MAKDRKSESLFGSNELNAPKQKFRRRTPEEMKEQREKVGKATKKDYIFRKELKKAFQSETEIKNSNSNDLGIIQELESMRERVSEKEMGVVSKANQRRKRHYLLNGDVVVYCYIQDKGWPRLKIRPLTISLDKEEIPPIEGYESEKETVLKVTFKPITIGIKGKIEPFIFDQLEIDLDSPSINYDEYKKLAFISCFKSWNIPVDVEFEGDRVSEESWSTIEKTIHPRLFDTLMGEFISLNEMHAEEVSVLEQQCERLFAKKSSGVSNPIEGIRLYCEASTFAKEFNLSGMDLDSLSYRVASMMRYVANKGNEIQIRQMDQSSNSNPKQAKTAKSRR